MREKIHEKERAIKLRLLGKTYNEILSEVNVSKSTLSLWLRDVGLTKKQYQRISQKRKEAQQKGAQAQHLKRVKKTQTIHIQSVSEIKMLSKRELWLIGIALYWAEGAKEKAHLISTGVDFGNTDHSMIKIYIKWLLECCDVPKNKIKISLYIHKNHQYRVEEVKKYWENVVNIPNTKIHYVYFKKHNPKTKRRKVDNKNYFGTLRIQVSSSSTLQRKIQGWIYGITGESCRVV